MSIIKKPYEISLWEDTLIFVGESGTPYEDIIKAEEAIVNQYYKETRLCTIGSDTMDSPARAVNGKLVRKVNGEVTFTFTVYYRYYDNQTGQLEYNPFVPYLTNERKVKLKYDDDWYDLIIKQIQENSESKAFTYTCKSQFVNELSKTGFELEFDNELENNMGTIEYLAEQILDGSDWQLEGNSGLKQFIEEPLYKVKIKSDAQLDIAVMNPIEEREGVPSIAGKEIYVFYSHINDKEAEWQFLYDDAPFSINDDLIIDKDIYPNYLIKSVSYAEDADWPEFVEYGSITSDYRGMRLVKQVRTIYDAKIDKYVQEYTKKDDTSGTVYYGFEETKYLSPNTVNNYAVNPNAFTSTTGWYTQPNAEGAKATLELVSDPPFNAENIGDQSINFTSYLKFPNNGGALINSSINSHKSSLGGFIEGESIYVLRLKCKQKDKESNWIVVEPTNIKICQYKDASEFEINKEIFVFEKQNGEYISTNEQSKDSNFVYYKAICGMTVTQEDLKDWDKYYGLFLTFENKDNKNNLVPIYIEDIQLFPYVLDNDGRLCVPGGELFSKIETTKKYYNPSQVYSSLEEIQFESAGIDYIPKYADGAEAYTKVSSITAKESNRFNLLQDLNEKFECWACFRVEHKPDTGEILYGKDKKWYDENGDEIDCPTSEVYRQQKFISFHEYAGKQNYVGFKYGINSKSIQRTLDSNAIVSKMIVKDNANQFARNGFCSIARAVNNSSKENFILNFDHYYRHGLLDLDVVTNDLYVDGNGYLGYYKKLKEINQDREGLIDEQANLLKEIANYEAQYQTYKTSHDSAIEERNQMENNIFLLIVPKEDREKDKADGGAKGLNFAEIIEKYSRNWESNSSYIKYTTSWMQCDNVIKQHLQLYQRAYEYLNGLKDNEGNTITKGAKERYEEIADLSKTKTEQKRVLNLQFYKKYSRFIQEGSWIKEDYVDDNLYYLDSLSTLHTSAQPKVTYNISVINVSSLPGYEDYEFKLGDITYIEDREFFGYSLVDGTTPYREEIVVSEIITELDAPEKNSIKVQNYKTQFEDLFQRITAQTQQAEYHTGEYKRAASIVEPNGNISVSTLENSFANNSFKLSNIRDQSVVIDSSGITTTSLANPSEMLRIVNGGIFMSTDGGQSWKTGLTGYGLNSSYLTAGQINTDEIYIMSGNQPAFGWDEKGISAYSLINGSYNLNKYVRFDQYGIYGKIADDDWMPSSIADIKNNASFGITWDGFFLKNRYGSGYVSIDSTNDFIVNDGVNNRVQIGNINNDSDRVGNPVYGIRISDAAGNAIMETSGGELWLQNRLRIGTKNECFVEIGGLNNQENSLKSVFNANDKFVVYEDGTVMALSGQFAGNITATGGTIGALQVDGQTLKIASGNVQITNEGIEIVNSGFSMLDDQGNKLLYASEGDVIFSGRLSGPGGNIGGFEIGEGKLISRGKHENSEGESEENIILNGQNGEIYAHKIILGAEASIDNYLHLGEAYLYNPTKNSNKVLECGKIIIKQDGTAQFGDISINGQESEIFADGWRLTSNRAIFNNIVASGSIETAVFKTGSTQAVGGAMIFKPSYRVDKVEREEREQWSYKLTLTESYEGSSGVSIWAIADQEYKTLIVGSVDENDRRIIYVQSSSSLEENWIKKIKQIVIIGTKDDLLIGINSGASPIGDGHILGHGLSISEYGNKLPKLFAGDLSQIGRVGYGLYSDNVYLNGALTTKSNSNHYAGINTLSGINGLEETYVKDTSPIIFWAGANSLNELDIQTAPFQVTEKGSIFASKATFSDSVFAGGNITSAKLFTSEIHGNNTDNNKPALSIFDHDTKGIVFYDQVSSETTETLSLSSNGIGFLNNSIIYKNDNKIIISGSEVKTNNDNHLALKNIGDTPVLYHHHSDAASCGFYFEKLQTSYKINESEKIAISESDIQMTGQMTLKSNQVLQYRPVEGGYDLYVV